MSRFGRWWLLLIIMVAISILIWDFLQPKINVKDIEEKVSLAIKEQNFNKAARILEQTLQREPNYHIGRVELVQAYIVLQKYKEAQQQLNVCFEKLGRDVRLLLLQIHIWERQQQWEQAYQLYPEIVQKEPGFMDARLPYLAVAIARWDQKIVDRELDDLLNNHKEELSPFLSQFRSLCAEWYRMQGKLAEAEEILTQLKDDIPENFDLQKEWLENQEIQGKIPQARAYYQNQLQKYPYPQTNQEDTKESQEPKDLEGEDNLELQKQIQAKNIHFLYQHLYVLTLPIQEAIMYSEAFLPKNERASWRMTIIDLHLRHGNFDKVIEHCQLLNDLPISLEMRKQAWLGNAYFMSRRLEEASKQAAILYNNPDYRSTGLLIKINIDLAKKNYAIVHQDLDELLKPYEKVSDWNIKLQKERARYQIWKIRAYAEAGDWVNVEKIAQILSAYPRGWSYSGQGDFWLASSLMAQKQYISAISIYQSIAKNPCFPASLRIRAGLWHGIAMHYANQNPIPIWEQYQEIPWENFTTDSRESIYYNLLLGIQKPEQMPGSLAAILANDTYFYLGLSYERAGRKEQAREAYQKGLDASFGQEFPYIMIKEQLENLK